MKKIAVFLALTISLSACVLTKNREMPANTGTGSDLMRSSPCACEPVDYDGRGFTRLG